MKFSLKVLWNKKRKSAWILRELKESLRVTWSWIKRIDGLENDKQQMEERIKK